MNDMLLLFKGLFDDLEENWQGYLSTLESYVGVSESAKQQ